MTKAINIASGFHSPGTPEPPKRSLAFQMLFVVVSFFLLWAATRL